MVLEERKCVWCEEEFQPSRNSQVYCGLGCKNAAKEHRRILRGKKPRYSLRRARWKG